MTISMNRGVWTEDEHDRFLEGMRLYPFGPWRCVAANVGTRDVRQVQTHAQKYFEKIGRHRRGLLRERHPRLRNEHRIDFTPRYPNMQPPQATLPMTWPPQEFKHTGDNQEEADMHLPRSLFLDPAAAQHSLQQEASSEARDEELPSLEETLGILMEYLSE